jgi:hypothetical protein
MTEMDGTRRICTAALLTLAVALLAAPRGASAAPPASDKLAFLSALKDPLPRLRVHERGEIS